MRGVGRAENLVQPSNTRLVRLPPLWEQRRASDVSNARRGAKQARAETRMAVVGGDVSQPFEATRSRAQIIEPPAQTKRAREERPATRGVAGEQPLQGEVRGGVALQE